MELEAKVRFALSTIRPMAQFTHRHVASVMGVVDAQTGEQIGSALRCVVGGRRAIVTALHVLERAVSEYSAVGISAGFGVVPYQVAGEVHFEKSADLAIYFLPEDYPEAGEKLAFWPEARIDVTGERRTTDYLFVQGYPGVRSRFLRLFAGVVSKSLPYAAMERPREELSGLEPFQFALNYDQREIHGEANEMVELPDPHGMSGSPVWRIGASGRSAAAWMPDWSVLVGIITQWRPNEEVLVATEASKILELGEKAR